MKREDNMDVDASRWLRNYLGDYDDETVLELVDYVKPEPDEDVGKDPRNHRGAGA